MQEGQCAWSRVGSAVLGTAKEEVLHEVLSEGAKTAQETGYFWSRAGGWTSSQS